MIRFLLIYTELHIDVPMNELKEILDQFELIEGFNQTYLPSVRLFRTEQDTPRSPLIYDPGLCIIAQGHKKVHLGERSFSYDAGNYLVTSLTIPTEVEACASPEEPLLGLFIDIDMSLLHQLIAQLGQEQPFCREATLPRAIGPAPLTPKMVDAVSRLLWCLQSKTESRILGHGLLREILFRALDGGQAPILYALASNNSNFARVARALKLIQNEYAESLDIESLAIQANMSISAFHRAFKEITSESPLQYLKKIRLAKARDHIVQDGMKAYIAADKVGYESASQFSREFKRHYGQSPTEMVRALRA